MGEFRRAAVLAAALCIFPGASRAAEKTEKLFDQVLDVEPKPIASDPSVRWDYDIVYVRAGRAGDSVHKRFYTDIAAPVYLEPGADLMLLHPAGSENLLVEGGEGAVTDPMVSSAGEGGGHLQDPRPDPTHRPPHHPGVHAEHRRRRLVARLPRAGGGEDPPVLRRP